MGAILLIDLDMKNGILLVEYIQQLRKEGLELRPALLLAGRARFRPILRTVLPQSKQEFAFARVSGNTLAEEHP
jgi:multidrug efflux pump subunit AcrB